MEKYAQRPWISHVLAGCSDKEKAFYNWMERDALFARCAAENARALGNPVIVNDGTPSVEEMYGRTIGRFGLK